MNNDLIERYIYAVTKRMDRRQRDDVAQELRTLIDDMLAERCGSLTPTEKDVRVVLTELGTPQELYAKYDDRANQCLIGQPYYTTYLFVMKIVLASVAVGITLANVILQLLEPQGWFAMAGTWLAMLYNSFLAAFAIVTLLFAFFSWKGVRLTEPFNFDDLPPVPKKSQEIPRWESIAGIVICIIFMVLLLFMPEVFTVVREKKLITLFDPQALRDSWLLVVAFSACGIFREAVQLMERRYNKKVLTTALVTNAISAVLAIWWLVGCDIMNQTFLENMHSLFAGEDAIVYHMFSHFDRFFLGCMLFALVLDTVDVVVKTLKK